MALLNPPQTLPQVMYLVYGYLLSAQRRIEKSDTLLEMLAPKSLVNWKAGDDDEDSEKGGKPDKKDTVQAHQKVVQFAINALKNLGIVEEDGENLRLGSGLPVRNQEPIRPLEGFKRLLRERILAPEANTNLWSEEGEEIGSRDLNRALAWWLVQDVFAPVAAWRDGTPQGVQHRQQQQLGSDQKQWVFSNDTRWSAFIRWAVYLGFAWKFGLDKQMLLMPDPTEAVRETLPQVFGKQKRLTLPDFLESLAQHLPVLDGGVHRDAVLERVKAGSIQLPAPDTLTTSLAHVLLRLHDEQVIELKNESDTTKRLFPVESGLTMPFSHIRLLTKTEVKS